MFLYITKTGTAFKVSTYRADEPVQPWVIDHPRYKMGLRSAHMLLSALQNGDEYANEELNALKSRSYSSLSVFERGVFSEVEHYLWCVKNNRKYITLSSI
ncbi:MAG: hypothetical protein ACO29Y_05875 [Holophagaceae bacterium]